MKTQKKLLSAGLLAAIAASLCCITPLLAIVAGTSGIASTFAWLEPFRPYLIGLTILVIGFAWYQKLKPTKEIDCDCETEEKPKFIQTKKFLGLVTILAGLLLLFPSYSHIFYTNQNNKPLLIDQQLIKQTEFSIEGMTCSGCEIHVNQAVNELKGIVNVSTSYANGTSVVAYDSTQSNLAQIKKAINSTGYQIVEIKDE